MTVDTIYKAGRTELECEIPGGRLCRFELWDDNQYIPYFYNPALDAGALQISTLSRSSRYACS